MDIDRTKHAVDIIERVLGAEYDGGDGYEQVVDLSTRPWLAGITATAVQIRVGLPDSSRRPRG